MDRLLSNRRINPSTCCWEWTGVIDKGGYGRISFMGKIRLVHRVAAAVFLGFDLTSSSLVCHHCDNSRCFNPEHLYVGSQKQNVRDAVNRGRLRPRHGVKAPTAKLTPSKVRAIRVAAENGASMRELGRRYGVHHSTVSKIVSGRYWASVTGGSEQLVAAGSLGRPS